MRITRGPYFADILRDGRVQVELWHWIVQREDSHQIFGMGQEHTLEDAQQCAEQSMNELSAQRATRKRGTG
ncbi:MAG TPA: hypothetical protein VI685_00745 [Candidatus Angelobacter sp.]